jgi:hypothetical protein
VDNHTGPTTHEQLVDIIVAFRHKPPINRRAFRVDPNCLSTNNTAFLMSVKKAHLLCKATLKANIVCIHSGDQFASCHIQAGVEPINITLVGPVDDNYPRILCCRVVGNIR